MRIHKDCKITIEFTSDELAIIRTALQAFVDNEIPKQVIDDFFLDKEMEELCSLYYELETM